MATNPDVTINKLRTAENLLMEVRSDLELHVFHKGDTGAQVFTREDLVRMKNLAISARAQTNEIVTECQEALKR